MIFSYGVTNAGKSYTMVGDNNNKGILPNILKWLLDFKNHIKINDNQFFNEIDLKKLFFL